jgi:glycosyltransferase involved in cell wall biosynthesis
MKVLTATAIYPSQERPALGTFVRTQVESLRKQGVDVEVLALRGGRSKYARGVVELRRRLAGGGFDLVHAHYSYVGVVARTQLELPVVVTYHGDDLLGTIGVRGRTTAFSRAAVVLGRALARTVDAAIVQTEQMARKLPRNRVHVIPHEVDFDLFRPVDRLEARQALGLRPERRYVLFAADPKIPVKRFSLARTAVERLDATDVDLELLVVSDQPQDRLALYMSACDALVFPSYQEGSPNVVKQAMACNLPIVATDVGDVRHVVAGTDACAVCEPEPDALAAGLREILAEPRRTDGRGRIERFAPEPTARQVIGVYEHVLATRARRPVAAAPEATRS